MIRDTLQFVVTDDILASGLTGTFFTIGPLRNTVTSVEFEELRRKVIQEVLYDLNVEKIEQDPVLQGFRRLHEAFNVSNRKNIASPENLLRHLLKSGDMPRVNLIVDIYNLVSLKTHLAFGAHDIAGLAGNIRLRRTDGTEIFWPIGTTEPKSVTPGEYAYIDEGNNEIICRLEVRQVEKTKVTADTKDCFYIVQGNTLTTKRMVEDAAALLIELTQRFCGGEVNILYSPVQ